MEAGATAAVVTNHWAKGGLGAVDLASAVVAACAQSRELQSQGRNDFKLLYPDEMSIVDKISKVCCDIYGAKGVELSPLAQRQIDEYTKLGFSNLPICCAKTHLSLSTDPSKKGVPTDFDVLVREVKLSAGAGFLYLLMGDIMTIPGLPTRPGFYDVDLDLETGRVVGLF